MRNCIEQMEQNIFFTGKYLSKGYFIHGAAEKITFNKNANCWVNNKTIKIYYL